MYSDSNIKKCRIKQKCNRCSACDSNAATVVYRMYLQYDSITIAVFGHIDSAIDMTVSYIRLIGCSLPGVLLIFRPHVYAVIMATN